MLFQFAAAAQTKIIHLRNETITTPPKPPVAESANRLAVATASTNGLFLIQFEGTVDSPARAVLRARGVDLLKYVPDDAFIARFNHVSPDTIRGLATVRWVGPYRPEHKVHPRLSAAIAAAAPTNQLTAVNVLVAPGATESEIAPVRALLASVMESRLRQGTILRGILRTGALDALAQTGAVLWVEPAPKRRLIDEAASKLVGGDDGNTGTPTLTQQMGYGGAGVTVCVADTGLDTGDTNTMHPDLLGRVTGFKYYGSLTDGSDGYGHGTHCAGIVAGNAATLETDPDSGAFYGLGVASSANLFIERIFDDNANEVTPFPTDETLTRDAVRSGAKIGSNSWGNDVQGEYDTDAAQFDELVRDADASTPNDQPYVLEFSAGNAGPGEETLDSPASGKNVIATGACENQPGTLALTYGLYADGPDTMADFSSRGPSADGRIKPDLVAPGTWIASAASAAAPNESLIAWSVIDNFYVFMGGTSMSGPHAAGAAAIFTQYYQALHTNATPSPALVKAALINSAEELDESNGGPGPIPNFDEGWGRLNVANLIVTNPATAPRYYQFLDQGTPLTTGQVYVQHALVEGRNEPLKITLAYTDVPGFPGAIPALVNDLDLEVVGPDGTLYRGNQFAAGESAPNAPSSDTLNNVEAVHLAQPLPGDYLVRVRARNIVEDARLDTAAIDQDFALVVSGDLARPGAGVVLLDRTNYTAPGVVQLEVLDTGRAASNSVNVVLKSTTEPAGETYTLQSIGSSGIFTGAVATVAGNAAVDGKLELHGGDAIEADYVDSGGVTRAAHAMADLNAPVVSGVSAVAENGVMTIQWQTSEPATSIVRYGTNQTLNLAVTNLTLTTSHEVKLTHLIPGQTYFFLISSSDAAGNLVTDNNAGAFFSFVGVATPAVLLVDAYEPDSDSTELPDGLYTNALAAAGYTFSFWKVIDRGPPGPSDLQGFPVVIWRTTDDEINYDGTNNTLTAQQQAMIESYLDGGGSFFMASMGILSQLGDVPFRRDVLQVAGFNTNPDAPLPCSDCDEGHGVPEAIGSVGDPITANMDITLDYTNYPSFDLSDLGFGVVGPDFSDTFQPATNATTIFRESVSGRACGISYPAPGVDSPGRVVFLSFPLDAVPSTGAAPDNDVALLRNALNFLAPGANGVASIFMDHSAYTIPDQVTVEVGVPTLAGIGHTQVTFSTSSTTNHVTVILNETVHPGLFRGTIVLVSTNVATTNQITVHDQDTLSAAYFDTPNHSNVVATANVNIVPPAISQVAATNSFEDIVVTWNTSTPSDSLVQFGEGILLERTAYSPILVTNHSVTVGGLLANHTYYYQVVSRDAAGNAAVDDNHGALYTFPIVFGNKLPWSDDLDSGATNWTVFPDPGGTDLNWELGTPQTALQTAAHSPPNAWGSNLKGQSVDLLISTCLVSPVFDLTGYSTVTLTFWDCFDWQIDPTFGLALEGGQIGIRTNSDESPIDVQPLPNFDNSADSAPHWQQETVDLSAYAGQTIQIVWYYFGIQSDSTLNGWLLDDFELTGVAGGGTIVISKNLGQGTFNLSGLVNQTGTALVTTITNAPPGQYTVDFGDVAFYQTPASQSNYLALNSTVTFTGNYLFLDANHNGISDAWEKYYFGSVSATRTRSTDSDGDGMSDYAEFIAGTDPTNAASNLRFLTASAQTNGVVKLQWSAIPGRVYQVQAATNLPTWTPVSDWLQAAASPMTYTATNHGTRGIMYRVQVRP